MFATLMSSMSLGKSECYGTVDDGYILNAVRLPQFGDNFTSYSYLGHLADRTYVHDVVRDVVVAALSDLADIYPESRYVLGETGLRKGGKMMFHATHQNGLSVDFFVPMKDAEGKQVNLPKHMFNKYGYDLELNPQGKYSSYMIDFESLASVLAALHIQAINHGIGIENVFFAPELIQYLTNTKFGGYIEKNINFAHRLPSVRHDEHFHIDFKVPCQPKE